MKRNEKTEFFNLKIGDRFYKFNDKKKIVFEKTGVTMAIEALLINRSYSKSFRSDTEVIFLRSTNLK